MATLTIRNVPNELHDALKERARKNRRSVNQEVIAELAAVAHVEESFGNAVIEKIWEMRSRMKGFMTADEIDAAKEEGRK